jgi:glycosyltransferase involved in cell wall biosynthesis
VPTVARPVRILAISEIPTPYRLPFYARLAKQPELELELVFCSPEEPDRPWQLDDALAGVPHRFLRGYAPSLRTRRRTFVYELNPGAVSLTLRSRHDAILVGGYSVFAEQVAIAAARLKGIPYLLHSESTLLTPRSPTVRLAKSALVGSVVRRAGAGLATGTAAAHYLQHYGLPERRIRIVPNTIDVAAYGRAAAAAQAREPALRAELGIEHPFVLFAGRLVEDKGVLDLLEAMRRLGPDAPTLVVAGAGPLADNVRAAPGVVSLGFVQPDRLCQLYALARWTVVPSHREPWGVVVNEALACGSPVIASDQVGAAFDLVEDGVTGRIVPARRPDALAEALAGPLPTGDPARGAIEGWTYEFGVEQFLGALEVALRGDR